MMLSVKIALDRKTNFAIGPKRFEVLEEYYS